MFDFVNQYSKNKRKQFIENLKKNIQSETYDARCISDDWKKVGEDIQNAINDFQKENELN